MTIEKTRRGTPPQLATFALTLDVGGGDTELSDFGAVAEGTLQPESRVPAHLPLVLASALPHPRRLVLDGESVYVQVFPARPEAGGQLLQIDRDSGRIRVIAPLVRPDLLAVDTEHVYWVDADGGALKRLGKLDGVVTTLATEELGARCLAVGEAGVFWATRRLEVIGGAAGARPRRIAQFDSSVTGLAVDDDDLLVALASGEMWRVTIDGVARQLFLTGQSFARGFVFDARRVYWIDDVARAIQSFAKRGGGTVRRLADAPAGEGCLALAEDALVWSDADARHIRVLRRDGARLIAASGLARPADLAAAGGWIAWINRGDGSVMTVRHDPGDAQDALRNRGAGA